MTLMIFYQSTPLLYSIPRYDMVNGVYLLRASPTLPLRPNGRLHNLSYTGH